MLTGKLKRLLKKGQRGQSLVEFSLTAIILLIILSGLLDLGRLYFAYVALEDAAGEAAMFLAVIDPECETAASGAECSGSRNAEWRAINATRGILDNDQLIVITNIPVRAVGGQVEVTIQYPYRFLTPLISAIAPEVTLTSFATQTIVNRPVSP